MRASASRAPSAAKPLWLEKSSRWWRRLAESWLAEKRAVAPLRRSAEASEPGRRPRQASAVHVARRRAAGRQQAAGSRRLRKQAAKEEAGGRKERREWKSKPVDNRARGKKRRACCVCMWRGGAVLRGEGGDMRGWVFRAAVASGAYGTVLRFCRSCTMQFCEGAVFVVDLAGQV